MNRKRFTIVTNIRKSFSIALYNFASALTLISTIFFGVRILYALSVIPNAISQISIKKIRLSISKFSILSHITQAVSAKKISIIASMKQSMKEASDFIFGFGVVANAGLLYKVGSGFSSKMPISATVIFAEFNALLDFDYDALGDLDIQTLGDMDYVLL